jgi:hypothetical protein
MRTGVSWTDCWLVPKKPKRHDVQTCRRAIEFQVMLNKITDIGRGKHFAQERISAASTKIRRLATRRGNTSTLLTMSHCQSPLHFIQTQATVFQTGERQRKAPELHPAGINAPSSGRSRALSGMPSPFCQTPKMADRIAHLLCTVAVRGPPPKNNTQVAAWRTRRVHPLRSAVTDIMCVFKFRRHRRKLSTTLRVSPHPHQA